MATAVVVLFAALWSGLVHLGLPLPAGGAGLHAGHGPLIVLGFLGTLIAVERAVALSKAWAYIAPAAAAAGGLAVLVGAPYRLGPVLATIGGLVLVAIFIAVHRIQPSLHNVVLASGACCWVVAAALWLAGWDVPRFVPWLAAFLVLTIVGERLELSRLAGAGRLARVLFVAVAGLFVVGLVVSLFVQPYGVRIAGVGLLGLAGWLARYDIARRTVRRSGVTRYMAVALLAGYGWLAVGGGLWLALGRMTGGPAYDAMLHAVFLGFVISMIFAHAPVIVPAVLGRPLPYRPVLYAPLALLHATLVLRLVGGDALGNVVAWQTGGVLNEVALLGYLALAAGAVLRGDRSHDRATARERDPATGDTPVRIDVPIRTGMLVERPTRPAEPSTGTRRGAEGAMPGDEVLDVRAEIPGRRHELIFAMFAELAAGRGYVLVNDRDPAPLRYQFEVEHHGEFGWEYLEQGPEVWRVRISRTAKDSATTT